MKAFLQIVLVFNVCFDSEQTENTFKLHLSPSNPENVTVDSDSSELFLFDNYTTSTGSLNITSGTEENDNVLTLSTESFRNISGTLNHARSQTVNTRNVIQLENKSLTIMDENNTEYPTRNEYDDTTENNSGNTTSVDTNLYLEMSNAATDEDEIITDKFVLSENGTSYTDNENITNVEDLDFVNKTSYFMFENSSYINATDVEVITDGLVFKNMLNNSDMFADMNKLNNSDEQNALNVHTENTLNTSGALGDKINAFVNNNTLLNTSNHETPVICTRIFPKVISNEFKVYLEPHANISDKTEQFGHRLRRYFPDNSCNLVITSVSKETVTWTDLSLNKSVLCSKMHGRRFLKGIANEYGVTPEFQTFFLPEFNISFVNFTATLDCNLKASLLNPLDVTVYVLGSLLLLGVVTVVIVFLRGKICEPHNINVNITPNSYQKYSLRNRQPAFLSPELYRSRMMATCNPAYIDDETIEPKAKHYVEN